MTQSLFCSEVEVGGFLSSLDLIQDAYEANLESSNSTNYYKLHQNFSGFQVLAFNCSNDYTTRFLDRRFDLVSSKDHQVVDFIATKVNPSFSINEAAVRLFEGLFVELKQLENQLIYKPLVITGRSLGGYIAILFTLWLQHVIDEKEADGIKGTKRPICITFGCPLVGNEALQKAISERPQWKSCFLNMVAKTDPIASFYSSNSLYKAFGTSFFCTESGGHTIYEDQESILAVLDTMASSRAGNAEIPDYGNHLKSIRKKILYRGGSELGKFNASSLRAEFIEAASLIEDSCFWAHVEEALILLEELKNEGSNWEKLEEFESYVMSAIKNYSLSPDVFLKGSSLMKWWSEYKQHKGSSYVSELAEFMNNERYRSYK